MKEKLPYISALGIILFLMLLFPFFRNAVGDFLSGFVDKKDNVVEEYERVKEGVGSFTDTVQNTQQDLEKTIDTVNQTAEDVKTMKEQFDELKGMVE